MISDLDKLKKFNNLLSVHSQTKHTIVLNPKGKYNNMSNNDGNITYDANEWNISENFTTWINELSKKDLFTLEEKILLTYQKICKDYTYDDNLISFITKCDDDTFDLPDWYGRDTDENWEKNREPHNRRVCFELSRYLAAALEELLGGHDDYNVCILWNKGLTHYYVAVVSDEYSITLDLDDFNNIKDLTRLKAGLTAEGIKIWEDKNNKFRNELSRFNEKRGKYAITTIEEDIQEREEGEQESKQATENKSEDIIFFENVMKVLIEKYDIDSQGIFEYAKELIDIKYGHEKRKKIWKKIEGEDEKSTRYIRCLILNLDDTIPYLIDVDKGILRPFDKSEFDKKEPQFFRFNDPKIGQDIEEHYDGR